MLDHDSPYDDRSPDLIARVRKMREAAERRMNAFGKIADYDVRRVVCHKSQASQQAAEVIAVTPQQSAKEEKLAASKKLKTPQAVLEFPLPSVSSNEPEGT
jgi:hypothetical protein